MQDSIPTGVKPKEWRYTHTNTHTQIYYLDGMYLFLCMHKVHDIAKSQTRLSDTHTHRMSLGNSEIAESQTRLSERHTYTQTLSETHTHTQNIPGWVIVVASEREMRG